jgi:hypothetical protein
MSLAAKVTVKIKSDDTTIKEDFLEYEEFSISQEDPILKGMIYQTKQKFKGELNDCDTQVSIKLTW